VTRQAFAASNVYDFIILDCPPFLGAVTLNALVAADLLIIPTQPEFFSAHALRSMMTTISQVRSQFNPNLIYRILITMLDRRNRVHRDVEEQIRLAFGEGVFETRIEVDTKLRESAIQGLPISHHHKHSRSALQYDNLAQELMQYVR
jgi:chromosome partitioning protein